MHQSTTCRTGRSYRGKGQHSRLAITLFRIVLSSKTLISMSCSWSRISRTSCPPPPLGVAELNFSIYCCAGQG